MHSPRQIAALKYMLFQNKEAGDLTKRIFALLIKKSNGLTKEVCLSLVENREGYTAQEILEAAYGLDKMRSSSGTTHLHALLCAMGSEFTFSHHFGDFNRSRKGKPLNNDGQFEGYPVATVSRPELVRPGTPLRHTFWVAKGDYSQKATRVVASREKLEQLDIKHSGLYSNR